MLDWPDMHCPIAPNRAATTGGERDDGQPEVPLQPGEGSGKKRRRFFDGDVSHRRRRRPSKASVTYLAVGWLTI